MELKYDKQFRNELENLERMQPNALEAMRFHRWESIPLTILTKKLIYNNRINFFADILLLQHYGLLCILDVKLNGQ